MIVKKADLQLHPTLVPCPKCQQAYMGIFNRGVLVFFLCLSCKVVTEEGIADVGKGIF
jgi:hypothetical protein